MKEKWQELCEQVIAERNSERLSELVAMLNSELEKRDSKSKLEPQSLNVSGIAGRVSSDKALKQGRVSPDEA
jgi:hypothetical protein